jgi:N-terminal C2 in EEIG1 and EHBP1 proteins
LNYFQVPKAGWDALMVVLIPSDAGRPTVRSDKAAVSQGICRWNAAVYETVKLSLDAKSGKVHDKIYQFLISAPVSQVTYTNIFFLLLYFIFQVKKLHLKFKYSSILCFFQFFQLKGSNKGGILGEASVNLGDYAEAFKPSTITLPLKGNTGAVLHVSFSNLDLYFSILHRRLMLFKVTFDHFF